MEEFDKSRPPGPPAPIDLPAVLKCFKSDGYKLCAVALVIFAVIVVPLGSAYIYKMH